MPYPEGHEQVRIIHENERIECGKMHFEVGASDGDYVEVTIMVVTG